LAAMNVQGERYWSIARKGWFAHGRNGLQETIGLEAATHSAGMRRVVRCLRHDLHTGVEDLGFCDDECA
jgi:hypothetical protein